MIVVGFNFKTPNPNIVRKNLTFVGRMPTYPLPWEPQYPNSNLPFNYKGQMRVVEFECRNLPANMYIQYISQYFYHPTKIINLVSTV